MRNVVQLCSAADNILLMRKWNHSFLFFSIILVLKYRSASLSEDYHYKQTWWTNDKTITELGYHKISWFVSGE